MVGEVNDPFKKDPIARIIVPTDAMWNIPSFEAALCVLRFCAVHANRNF